MPILDPTERAISYRPLPADYLNRPDAIALWVDATAPCLRPTIPQSAEVTSTVIMHLRQKGVRDEVIAAALSQSAYQFTFPTTGDAFGVVMHMRVQPKPQQPNSMSAAAPIDRQKAIFQAQQLDVKFQTAERAGNTVAMKEIIKALMDLLGKTGEAWHDMQKDKERLDQVRAEILRNSPNIARIIQPFGPKEPPVPGPGGRTPRQIRPNTFILTQPRMPRGGR